MNILKKHSTKPERQLADFLIKEGISFEFRKVIKGREVDFVIGRVIIEVDGVHHRRRRESEKKKNINLAGLGYIPLHFSAKEIRTNARRSFDLIKRLIALNK